MKDVKVEVTLTKGYQQRFTEACLKQIKLNEDTEDQKKKIA